MHEQMSLRRLADLPAKDQEALDIFAGRGDLVGLRLDHIMKAQDQPPVRRERGELGRIRRVRAKNRQDVRHPGGGMLANFRDAADGDARRRAVVLIGSLSRWQARQNFSRIKAESEYGAAEFLTKPVDFDQLKIQLRELPNASA